MMFCYHIGNVLSFNFIHVYCTNIHLICIMFHMFTSYYIKLLLKALIEATSTGPRVPGLRQPGSFTTSSYGYRCAFRSCGDGGVT